MPKKNNQAQDLLNEFKSVNGKASAYLDSLGKKIAELDLKYAQQLVKNDISMMQAAKSVLLSKKK